MYKWNIKIFQACISKDFLGIKLYVAEKLDDSDMIPHLHNGRSKYFLIEEFFRFVVTLKKLIIILWIILI